MPSLKGCLLFLASTPLALGAIAGLRPVRRSLVPFAIGKNTTETEYCTHVVQSGDNLWAIAQINYKPEIELEELYRLNPAFRDPDRTLQPGEVLKVPCRDLNARLQPDLTSPCTRNYTVQPGDGLFTISIKESVGLRNLKAWNNVDDRSVLQPGQTLCVSKSEPVKCRETRVVKLGDTCLDIAKEKGIDVPELGRLNPDLLGVDCSIVPGHRLCVAAGDQAPADRMLPDPSRATNGSLVPGERNAVSPAETTDDGPGGAVVPAAASTNGKTGAVVPAAAYINGETGASINDATGAVVPRIGDAPGVVVPGTNNAASPAGTTDDAPGAVASAAANIKGETEARIGGAPEAVGPAAASTNGKTGARIGGAPEASGSAGSAESSANGLSQPNGASSYISTISPDLLVKVTMVEDSYLGNVTERPPRDSKAMEQRFKQVLNVAFPLAQSTQPMDVAIGRRQSGLVKYLVKILISLKVTVQNGQLQRAGSGTTAIVSRNPAFDVRIALSVNVRKGGHAGASSGRKPDPQGGHGQPDASPGKNTIPQGGHANADPQGGHGQTGASPSRNADPQGGHGQPDASPSRNTDPQGGHGQPGASPSHNGPSASPGHISVSQDVRIQAGGSPNSVSIDASTQSSPQKGTADGGEACH